MKKKSTKKQFNEREIDSEINSILVDVILLNGDNKKLVLAAAVVGKYLFFGRCYLLAFNFKIETR
jgi:hypothetical protein